MHIIALMRRMFFIFLFYKSYSYEPSLRRRDEGPHEGDCLSPLLAMVDCRKKEEPLAEALRGKVGETCMGGVSGRKTQSRQDHPPTPTTRCTTKLPAIQQRAWHLRGLMGRGEHEFCSLHLVLHGAWKVMEIVVCLAEECQVHAREQTGTATVGAS